MGGGGREAAAAPVPAAGRPFAFAGVWEPPCPGANHPAPTFAVPIVPAGDGVREFHDRMPAVLLPDEFAAWLDPRAGWPAVRGLLRPLPRGEVVSRPVSPALIHPRNDRPELLRPVLAGLFG